MLWAVLRRRRQSVGHVKTIVKTIVKVRGRRHVLLSPRRGGRGAGGLQRSARQVQQLILRCLRPVIIEEPLDKKMRAPTLGLVLVHKMFRALRCWRGQGLESVHVHVGAPSSEQAQVLRNVTVVERR